MKKEVVTFGQITRQLPFIACITGHVYSPRSEFTVGAEVLRNLLLS
jgi:hypothetical protein